MKPSHTQMTQVDCGKAGMGHVAFQPLIWVSRWFWFPEQQISIFKISHLVNQLVEWGEIMHPRQAFKVIVSVKHV